MIRLVVPGTPMGKGRARFVKATGRAFTPKDTLRAEQRIQLEWIHAGRPVMRSQAITIHIQAVLRRPRSHFKTDGSLTAAGDRNAHPTKRPDWDNIAKLVGDALNGLAYRDDACIVMAEVLKRWCEGDEDEHTTIEIAGMP